MKIIILYTFLSFFPSPFFFYTNTYKLQSEKKVRLSKITKLIAASLVVDIKELPAQM
jgi:hypothetical protein